MIPGHGYGEHEERWRGSALDFSCFFFYYYFFFLFLGEVKGVRLLL